MRHKYFPKYILKKHPERGAFYFEIRACPFLLSFLKIKETFCNTVAIPSDACYNKVSAFVKIFTKEVIEHGYHQI